jgi:hypothetical protein
MKRTLTLAALALMVIVAPPLRGEDEPSKKSEIWMRQKLQASQTILKALAEGDFPAIAQNAQAMSFMDFLEKWLRSESPGYRAQLQVFEFANKELIRAAREKNIDAATLAYTQLTISCVNCHKIVRDAAK